VYALLSKSWRIGAQDELCGCRCEFRKTGDWKVFVIKEGVVSEDFVCLEIVR
jgi:hypothetical protein